MRNLVFWCFLFAGASLSCRIAQVFLVQTHFSETWLNRTCLRINTAVGYQEIAVSRLTARNPSNQTVPCHVVTYTYTCFVGSIMFNYLSSWFVPNFVGSPQGLTLGACRDATKEYKSAWQRILRFVVDFDRLERWIKPDESVWCIMIYIYICIYIYTVFIITYIYIHCIYNHIYIYIHTNIHIYIYIPQFHKRSGLAFTCFLRYGKWLPEPERDVSSTFWCELYLAIQTCWYNQQNGDIVQEDDYFRNKHRYRTQYMRVNHFVYFLPKTWENLYIYIYR